MRANAVTLVLFAEALPALTLSAPVHDLPAMSTLAERHYLSVLFAHLAFGGLPWRFLCALLWREYRGDWGSSEGVEGHAHGENEQCHNPQAVIMLLVYDPGHGEKPNDPKGKSHIPSAGGRKRSCSGYPQGIGQFDALDSESDHHWL
jgi:hypothetical protein